jgi:hypothetical protein
MEIDIEIGSKEEKEAIKDELDIFLNAFPSTFFQTTQLQKIVIPFDFQAEINKLENTDTYKATRDYEGSIVNVRGKIVESENGFIIVLSPFLYTQDEDTQTRMQTVFHELSHAINRRDFPKTLKVPYVSGMYYEKLYSVYDEYSCDCFASKITDKIFPSKSALWEKHISENAKGFIEVITNKTYYENLREAIKAFRIHEDTNRFLESTNKKTNEMIFTLVHTFSLAHSYPSRISQDMLKKSLFVNEKTFALMDYLKEKESKGEKRLNDGLDLFINFFENFGIRYEYVDEERYYCRVLDI